MGRAGAAHSIRRVPRGLSRAAAAYRPRQRDLRVPVAHRYVAVRRAGEQPGATDSGFQLILGSYRNPTVRTVQYFTVPLIKSSLIINWLRSP